jgi:F0F1-type ATP synthase membrane subunit b/b'
MNRRRWLFSPAVLAAAALLLSAPPVHAAEGGLEIFPDPFQLALLIAVFVLLVVPVNAVLVRPLLRTLDERAQRIEGARSRAGELGQEADAALARHRNALDAARAAAEGERRTALEGARAEQTRLTAAARSAAELEIERARREIRSGLAEAREVLRRDTEALAREAVARILGRPVS